MPTEHVVALTYNHKGSHWLEGEKEDQTAWEIGHFLKLATACNPTIMECFVAPRIELDEEHYGEEWSFTHWDEELLNLFPHIWNPKDCFNAFCGYGKNQRTKMLDNHLGRWNKFGVAYLRTVYNLCDLLETGKFSLVVTDQKFKEVLVKVKHKEYTVGSIIDMANDYIWRAEKLLLTATNPNLNLEKVNEYLVKVRREFWNERT